MCMRGLLAFFFHSALSLVRLFNARAFYLLDFALTKSPILGGFVLGFRFFCSTSLVFRFTMLLPLAL